MRLDRRQATPTAASTEVYWHTCVYVMLPPPRSYQIHTPFRALAMSLNKTFIYVGWSIVITAGELHHVVMSRGKRKAVVKFISTEVRERRQEDLDD